MKLLERVSHPIYLLVLIIGFAIFLNRGALFGGGDSRDPSGPFASRPEAGSESVSPVEKSPSTAPQTVESTVTAGTPLGDSAEAVADAEPSAPHQLWREARVAAWHGDLERSEHLYRKLAQASPTNMDAFGELGNVLMRKGEWKAAAQAYYQAALRARENEQPGAAWYLHSVIAGLDHNLAVDLRQRLKAE